MRKEALGIFWGLQRRTTSGFHGIFFLGDGAWKIRSECEEQDLMLLEVTRNFLVLPTSSSKGLPTFRSISDTIGWVFSNGWLIPKHCGYFRFFQAEQHHLQRHHCCLRSSSSLASGTHLAGEAERSGDFYCFLQQGDFLWFLTTIVSWSWREK